MFIMDRKKDIYDKWANVFNSNPGLSKDEDKTFILPIATRIVAQTIGIDLVEVVPIGGGNTSEENKLINQDIKIENRDRRIDSLLEDSDYEEMKREDHPLFKKSKGPSSVLHYIDFKYK